MIRFIFGSIMGFVKGIVFSVMTVVSLWGIIMTWLSVWHPKYMSKLCSFIDREADKEIS